MNTGARGDAAVLLASAKLTEAGLVILKPTSECLSFDLVSFDGGNFSRLQIKRAYPISLLEQSKFKASLRRINMTAGGAVARKYSSDDTDFIIAVVMETNDVYCFPIDIVANRNSITLNPHGIKSNHITNKKATNTEPYKNIITLHNRIYKL